MPLPKPKRKEKRSEFVSRFLENANVKKEFPTIKQRLAIAYNSWRKIK